jgi:hypothetical protein
MMNIGPVEILLLLVGAISLLGPVLAGAYLAVRLSRRHRDGTAAG